MADFEITWVAPKHSTEPTIETVSFDYFEDAQEDLVKRLADLGIAEHECYYKIKDAENGHTYIIMKMGRCLVRGW